MDARVYLDNVWMAQSGEYGHFLSDQTQLSVFHPTFLHHPALPDELHYNLEDPEDLIN